MANGRTGKRRVSGTPERDLTKRVGTEPAAGRSDDEDHIVRLRSLGNPTRENVHTNCTQGSKRSCAKCKKEIDLCEFSSDSPLDQLPVIDRGGGLKKEFLHFKCAPVSYQEEVAEIIKSGQASEESAQEDPSREPAVV